MSESGSQRKKRKRGEVETAEEKKESPPLKRQKIEEEESEEDKKKAADFLKLQQSVMESVSSLKIAQRNQFGGDQFARYVFDDFNVNLQVRVINNLSEYVRAQSSTLLDGDVLANLDAWYEGLKREFERLGADYARKMVNRTLGDGFNQNSATRKWERMLDMKNKIVKLLVNHERSTLGAIASQTVRMKKEQALSKRRKKRLEMEQRDRDRNVREMEGLEFRNDVQQLKYFIRNHGPTSGWDSFQKWKGDLKLKQGSKSLANMLDNDPKVNRGLLEEEEDDDLNDDIW